MTPENNSLREKKITRIDLPDGDAYLEIGSPIAKWSLFRKSGHIRTLNKFEQEFVDSAILAAISEAGREPSGYLNTFMQYPDSPEDAPGYEVTTIDTGKRLNAIRSIPLYTAPPTDAAKDARFASLMECNAKLAAELATANKQIADMGAKLAAVRAETIEECAELCDRISKAHSWDRKSADLAGACRDEIRAIAQKGHSHE